MTMDSLPLPPQDDTVETLHGKRVPDPYRPLEDLDSPKTTAWWQAQNKRTQALLKPLAKLRAETIAWHTKIRDYTRESLPATFGEQTFFSRQSGLEAQPTYYVKGSAGDARVLLDPKTLSAEGTTAVGGDYENPTGTQVAFTLSEAGSDLQTLQIRDVATGKVVEPALTGLRFSGACWDPDGKGLCYVKPLPSETPEAPSTQFAAYHHALGTPQADDTLVYARPDVPNGFISPYRLTEDDPYLFANIDSGTSPDNGLAVRMPDKSEFTELFPPLKAALSPFHRDGDTLYAITTLDAPKGRVVRFNMNTPDAYAPSQWETLIAEPTQPGQSLQSAFVLDGQLLVQWSQMGAHTVTVHDLSDGKQQHTMPLPPASTVQFAHSRPTDKDTLLAVGGFLTPGTRYRYTPKTNTLAFVKKSDIPRDLTDVATVEQRFATSKDGTQVPMWVIAPKNKHKGLKHDGKAATLLYGYGGFNVPLAPAFSMGIMHWVEHGGVFVMANLRGGGEFGMDWYNGGRLKNKQNCFDDFAACAQKLITDKVTSPKRLAISGGSNGGLLTAVVSQQYPKLFGAVISDVPVTDMLRFHTNNFGAAWMSDYGDPGKPDDFQVALAYSPLHNVKPAKQTAYPPMLISTGDHDDRVAPWHAFKLAATRQAAGHANTFLRVDTNAGHGAGKPTEKVIEESADRYAFLVKHLGPLSAKLS